MPYYALSMGMTQRFFVFCPWRPWPLTLTLKLGRDFCTVYLTAKFDRPTFSRSEVIVRTNKQTNKQTPLKTCTSLRYAMLVGNAQSWLWKRCKLSTWLSKKSSLEHKLKHLFQYNTQIRYLPTRLEEVRSNIMPWVQWGCYWGVRNCIQTVHQIH